MPSNVDIESWKFSPREPTSPSIGRLKTRVMTLPEKLRNLAASIRVQEDLSMELDSLAHVAETLLTPKPSEAHQIDVLIERVEIAEGLLAQIRFKIWRGHGHVGIYGDDGEMQCGQCSPNWDYKRAPLMELVNAVLADRKSMKDEIEDWRLRHRNLSRFVAEVITNAKAVI